MNYAQESWQFLGGLSRFLWQLLTRFSKTVGCLAIIAGFIVAGSLFQQSQPMIEAVRYHESGLPAERLRRVEELYLRTHQVVVEFHGASELPPEYASAAFTPKFPTRFITAANFDDALAQLSRIAEGKQFLKRSLTDRFEKFVREIQQTLRSHATSIAPPKAPPPALPALPPPPMAGLYENEGQRSNNDARKEALDQASEVLATLKSAAEKPEKPKKAG